MLKIEQFVKDQFGIELTKDQLEIIAIIASAVTPPLINTDIKSDKSIAFKAAYAYLQDGLTEVKNEA